MVGVINTSGRLQVRAVLKQANAHPVQIERGDEVSSEQASADRRNFGLGERHAFRARR